MNRHLFFAVFVVLCFQSTGSGRKKKYKDHWVKYPKYNNPNYVNDRDTHVLEKYYDKNPDVPYVHRPSIMNDEYVNRFNQQFHPAFMDRCELKHCNDYHKIACGLNRKTMRFKWFQSKCHMALNNICSHYTGNLRYDHIDDKHCHMHVLKLRTTGCRDNCDDDSSVNYVCGMSSYNHHVVLFKSECHFEKANCHPIAPNEYEKVYMDICRTALIRQIEDNDRASLDNEVQEYYN